MRKVLLCYPSLATHVCYRSQSFPGPRVAMTVPRLGDLPEPVLELLVMCLVDAAYDCILAQSRGVGTVPEFYGIRPSSSFFLVIYLSRKNSQLANAHRGACALQALLIRWHCPFRLIAHVFSRTSSQDF